MIRLLLSSLVINNEAHLRTNNALRPTPTRKEILLTEQALVQAKQKITANAIRLDKEVRTVLAKPSTIIGVAGAAGFTGFLMGARSHHNKQTKCVQQTQQKKKMEEFLKNMHSEADLHLVKDEEHEEHAESEYAESEHTESENKKPSTTSFKGVITGFALRYAMHRLPDIVAGIMTMVEQPKHQKIKEDELVDAMTDTQPDYREKIIPS